MTLGLLLATSLPALAHSYADPALRTVLDQLRPALPPSVVVAVVPSVVDQLAITNPTAVPLEVLSPTGSPFLRVSSAGVWANLADPDWYLTGVPEGQPALPSGVRTGAAPRWARVSTGSSWSEFDPRLRPAVTVTPELRAAGERRILSAWAIPLRYGTQQVTAQGHVLFDPVRGGFVVAVTQQPAGLAATALQGELPGLFVRVSGRAEVVVLGRDARPFLRFRDGVAEVNLASPTWHEDQAASGQQVRGTGWQRVGTAGTFSWLDSRLRYPADLPPPGQLDRAGVVLRWTVPVLVSGQREALAGTVTWVPRAVALRSVRAASTGSGGWSWAVVALGAAVLLGVIWFLARGRRSRNVEEVGR